MRKATKTLTKTKYSCSRGGMKLLVSCTRTTKGQKFLPIENLGLFIDN